MNKPTLKTMKKILLLLPMLLSFWTAAVAQQAGLDKMVSLNYQNVELGNVLEKISEDYRVYFSYSRDFIPVKERISISIYQQPLSKALDELLGPTKVVYAPIGDQIVLKIDPSKPVVKKSKRELTGSLDNISIPPAEPVYTATLPPARNVPTHPTPLLRTPDLQLVEWDDEGFVLEEDARVLIPYAPTEKTFYQKIAQVSVVPDLGTNFKQSEVITNNVSVNILWGKNGGVHGVEIGGLANVIEGDVRGIQLAGLVNHTKGELTGTREVKKNKTRTAGLQVSGIYNRAESVRGGQISAGVNSIFQGDLKGLQMAGIGNVIEGNSEGWQLAGLFNNNQKNAGCQLAGVFNKAEDVSAGQIGGVINIARDVRGFQIGLINVADTISGPPIGMLNFIKHGFNRLEISRSESLALTAGVKFGAPSFYNIFELSTVEVSGERSAFRAQPHWALGYGIGTSLRHEKKWSVQLEAVITHINEGEAWTSKLNLLQQLRILGNLRLAKHLSIYGGPTLNLFMTRLYDLDTREFTSGILRESAALDGTDFTGSPLRIQSWSGMKFGLRF